MDSTGGVKTTVTPTTTRALRYCLRSAGASPRSCSVVVAKSLNRINDGSLCSLLRHSKVGVEGRRGSYKLVVFRHSGRSIRTNNSNYKYTTSILYSGVVSSFRGKLIRGVLFVTANTLVDPASDKRKTGVPSVTRLIGLGVGWGFYGVSIRVGFGILW